MRELRKNKQPFYYSLYCKEINVYEYDENGNIVYVEVDGVKEPVVIGVMAGYSAPVEFEANISAGKGSARDSLFGSDIDYTRTISTCDMTCPIDELSIIWIESEPQYNADGTVDADSADYKVAAYPARGLDNIVYAIKKLPKGN